MGDNAAVLKKTKKIICIYVVALIALALLAFIAWKTAGADVASSLMRALCVLLIGCPLALALSAKSAIKQGEKKALQSGFEFKNAEDLLGIGKTQIVAMNKIGTITKGEYVVTDVFSADHITKSGYNAGVFDGDDELLETAHLLGALNDHPMSKAIYKHTNELYVEAEHEVENVKVYPGGGLEGEFAGVPIRGGSLRFVEEKAIIPPEIRERALVLSQEGKTPIYFSKGRRLLGIIAVADSLIDNTAQAISEFKNMGIKVVMLTGDNEYTGKAIAEKIGIEDVLAEVTPDKKEENIKRLSGYGRLTFIGDECGLDNVLVMKRSLMDVVTSVRMSRIINAVIKENMIFSIIYAAIGVLLAAGICYPITGFLPGPVFCIVAALVLAVLVVLNSMRLQLYDFKDKDMDKPVIIN